MNKIISDLNSSKGAEKMNKEKTKTMKDVAKTIDIAKEIESSYKISLTDEQKNQLRKVNDRLARYFLLNHPEKLA